MEKKLGRNTRIRELHDFVTIAVPSNKIVKARENCYSVALHDMPMKVKKDFNATDLCIPKIRHL